MDNLSWALWDYARILQKIESGRYVDDWERVSAHREIVSEVEKIGISTNSLETVLHNFPRTITGEYLYLEARRIILNDKRYERVTAEEESG
jgi:hypothetical protein